MSAGERPRRALVCVHGLAGSSRWWKPVVPALSERFDVRLVDLPRYRFLSRVRPADAAAWLAGWLDDAELVAPVLVGHSLGGLIAAQLAAREPDRIHRLVLVDPAGVPSGRALSLEPLALASSIAAVRPRFFGLLVADALRWGPDAILRGGLYALGTDVRIDLASIRAPTLVVWGERDLLIPRRLAETWRDAIPGARLTVLPDAAHVPMVESPSAFVQALFDFLEEGPDEPGDTDRS
jgi:pimeloyl-ACP methyl ester carboxylesterase